MVTPLTLIGWLCYDYENKIIYTATDYCCVWWPMVAGIRVIIIVPVANPWVQSFIGLKKANHSDNLLASMSLYTYGLN